MIEAMNTLPLKCKLVFKYSRGHITSRENQLCVIINGNQQYQNYLLCGKNLLPHYSFTIKSLQLHSQNYSGGLILE